MTTNDAVRGLLSWLATYGLHSTIFLGGAWALCALRPLASRTRERVWKLALIGGLASATLQLASGARPILGRIDWQTIETAREAAPVAPLDLPAPGPGSDPASSPSEPELAFQDEASPRGPSLAEASMAHDEARPERSTHRESRQVVPPRPSRTHESERALASGAPRSTSPDVREPRTPALVSRL